MDLKELLFGGYQDTVNDVVGNSYRNEYFERYSPPYICKMCGKTFSEATRDCTVDHIIPQHLGGTNAMTNLQILCQSCNSKKNINAYSEIFWRSFDSRNQKDVPKIIWH